MTVRTNARWFVAVTCLSLCGMFATGGCENGEDDRRDASVDVEADADGSADVPDLDSDECCPDSPSDFGSSCPRGCTHCQYLLKPSEGIGCGARTFSCTEDGWEQIQHTDPGIQGSCNPDAGTDTGGTDASAEDASDSGGTDGSSGG